MSDNQKQLTVTPLLTKSFLESILKHSEDDLSLQVTDYRVEQGCKPGDHFCSSMVKVLVNYATENGTKVVNERSLIVKTDAFQGKVQAELFGDISIFGPEIRIYSETLPAMEKIQKAAGIERIFWPKLIHCNNSTAMIVMEDLRPDYSMVHYGIPFDDLSLVVDNLAQFHALSLVVHEQDPSLTDYKNNVFTEENSDFIRTLMRGLQTLTKQTAQWTGFDKIHKKLSSLPEKLVTRVCEIYEGKCCSFNVLNHGDFHIRNLMFKRTNGCDVDDVKFLDFQICNWGSPAIDLSLLVHVNGDKHVADRREEIYLRYYESFRDYLRRFGYSKAKIPSLLDLKLEILRCGAVEVFVALCLLPLFHLDVETVEFNKVYDATTNHMIDVTLPIYEDPEMIATMKRNLTDFHYRGLLD